MRRNGAKGVKMNLIFDFDSTIVGTETLDELVKSKLETSEQQAEIDAITLAAMDGRLDFHASITRRFAVANLTAEDFKCIARNITGKITPGFVELICARQERRDEIFIVSGGFIDTIMPIASILGIPRENCFANDCEEVPSGLCLVEGPLLYDGGKNIVVRALKVAGRLPGRTVMIGDGMSDFGVFASGDADDFIGFGAHVVRPRVLENAPNFAMTAEELAALLDNLSAL